MDDLKRGIGIVAVLFLAWMCCCGGAGKIDNWHKSRDEEKMRAIAEKERLQQQEREAAQKAAEADKKSTELAKADIELQKFAKEIVPDLQKAIERHSEQIRQFTDQRAAFARDMAALGVDPDKRPAYVRKKELIDKMAKDVDQLLAARKETYIRWLELNLLRDTPETNELRDKLLKSARSAATAAEETFDKLMKQSLEAVPN